jgi:ribonuclease P protein component
MRLCTLRRSAEFRRLHGGARWSGPGFLIEGRPRDPGAQVVSDHVCTTRFGFTVTRKLGGAVVRNRIRRRLKEVLRTRAGASAEPGFDYVIVARSQALERPFEDLGRDFERAFAHIRTAGGRKGRPALPADTAAQGPAAAGVMPVSAGSGQKQVGSSGRSGPRRARGKSRRVRPRPTMTQS